MLKIQFRLRHDLEIRKVLSKGRGFYGQFLSVKVLPNNLENSRFCFVVANKISKKSSKRNLLKRRLREIIRLNLNEIKPKNDVVIMAKPSPAVLKAAYKDLEQELGYLLKKSGLLAKSSRID